MPEAALTPPRRTLAGGPARGQPSGLGEQTELDKSPFVELGIASCFSFLRGASDAVDLVSQARDYGYDALGIADANSMAGIVRLHSEAKHAGLRPVIGCRIEPADGPAFLAYPKNRSAYGRICTLLSKGKMQRLDGSWQEKGGCAISLDMLEQYSEDVILIALPPDNLDAPLYPPLAVENGKLKLVQTKHISFAELIGFLPDKLLGLSHIAVSHLYRGDDIARINRLAVLAKGAGLAILATNDVLYHQPERRPLHDIMTCIRHKTTLANAGHLLEANGERHLKSPAEMQRLFADWPHAGILRTHAHSRLMNCATNIPKTVFQMARHLSYG
jgi:error-prone DNA polymerase